MKLDKNGYDLIKTFEGLSLTPYKCSAGVPTIGYGNTFYPNGKKVSMKDAPITKEKASEILVFTADLVAKEVTSLLKKQVNQNQFNALVSFAYNLGADIDADDIPEGVGDSTLLKKVNANPKDAAIATEFLKWNKAKGKVLKGLTLRRKKEIEVYFTT